MRNSVYGVPKHARNPEMAKEWLNWVVTKEPQTRMVEFGYGTPNKHVQYTEAQAKAVIVADPEVVKRAVPEDFEIILNKSLLSLSCTYVCTSYTVCDILEMILNKSLLSLSCTYVHHTLYVTFSK